MEHILFGEHKGKLLVVVVTQRGVSALWVRPESAPEGAEIWVSHQTLHRAALPRQTYPPVSSAASLSPSPEHLRLHWGWCRTQAWRSKLMPYQLASFASQKDFRTSAEHKFLTGCSCNQFLINLDYWELLRIFLLLAWNATPSDDASYQSKQRCCRKNHTHKSGSQHIFWSPG